MGVFFFIFYFPCGKENVRNWQRTQAGEFHMLLMRAQIISDVVRLTSDTHFGQCSPCFQARQLMESWMYFFFIFTYNKIHNKVHISRTRDLFLVASLFFFFNNGTIYLLVIFCPSCIIFLGNIKSNVSNFKISPFYEINFVF